MLNSTGFDKNQNSQLHYLTTKTFYLLLLSMHPEKQCIVGEEFDSPAVGYQGFPKVPKR